jgi:hypothetical protein
MFIRVAQQVYSCRATNAGNTINTISPTPAEISHLNRVRQIVSGIFAQHD